MTGKETVDRALVLIGHVNTAGVVEQNRENRFYGMAPALLTALIGETARAMNAAPPAAPIGDLSAELPLDDTTAQRVLPSGLAMYFGLLEKDSDLYNHYSEIYYEKLLASLKPDEVFPDDPYNLRGDPTMQ